MALKDLTPDPRSIPDRLWVVLPTYNEAENLEPISRAILAAVPQATLLVVDDASPDGTGGLADELAAADPRIQVLHRPGKEGLGPAYRQGFRVALDGGASIVVQMDADFSHDPATLPDLIKPIVDGVADMVIGSRYTRGGRVLDWGLGRRVISRGGSVFARTVLGLPVQDLTGGFKAWRSDTLAAVSGGEVRAGARVVEIPVTFADRRVGNSKMSRRIVGEAFLVVLALRWEELRGISQLESREVSPERRD